MKGSTIINSVLTCSITIVFSLTRSLMAKYLMSTCLFQLLLLLFLAIKTVAELLQYIFNSLEIESTTLSPKMKLFNHTPCKVASKRDMNSTSIVEVVVKVWFAFLQEIAQMASIKTYLEVDFLESMQPT